MVYVNGNRAYIPQYTVLAEEYVVIIVLLIVTTKRCVLVSLEKALYIIKGHRSTSTVPPR